MTFVSNTRRDPFDSNLDKSTSASRKRDREDPNIYSLEIPYKTHIQAIFQAAFSNNPNRVDFLFGHPLFKERIQAHVNPGEPRPLFHLIGLIQELPKKDLLKIANYVLQFTKDNPQDSDLLYITLINILNHPSLKESSLEEILSWITLLSQSPCSRELFLKILPSLFQHPSVQKASKLELFSSLDRLPDMYKIPFLVRMTKQPFFASSTLSRIKYLMGTFNTYYETNPCSITYVSMFYSALFRYGSMSEATIKDLSSFFDGVSDPCRIILSSFVLQHQAFAVFPENGTLDLIKSILLHHSLQQMPREKFFKSFVEPAKGYTRMNFIKLILSEESYHSFTLEEFKQLCSLFLEELEPSDHPGLKEFTDAACSFLIRNRIQGLEIQSQTSANEIIVDILEEFSSRLENDAMDEQQSEDS